MPVPLGRVRVGRVSFHRLRVHEQALSDEDLLRLRAEEYTFITRPVIVRGDTATAGFSAKRIDALVDA